MENRIEPSAGRSLRFGVFEIDPVAGDLRKQGTRVRLQEQPLQILLMLVARPGEVVSRDQLRQRLWPADTFVDFEHGLNAAVKRLRDALGDSAENPRFIETLPRRGYRFLLPVDGLGPARVAARPGGRLARASAAVLAALVCLLVIAVTWRLARQPPPAGPDPVLTRLTSDAGLTTDPAVSPDGTLLAYASDRSGDGNLDIWVQQLTRGGAIRLTRHEADDREPSFSPDGARVVFRSSRNGGGIYVVSALGGEERLVAPEGRRPRFSPDGSRIAYWVGDVHSVESQVYVVSVTGGTPRRLQLQPEFVLARYPAWSPDGKHLLFEGIPTFSEGSLEKFDWWVSPADGGQAVQVGVFEALRTQFGLPLRTRLAPTIQTASPGQWLGRPDRVVFSFPGRDSADLWEVGLDADRFHVAGPMRRLTVGPGTKLDPSAAGDGRTVFASVVSNLEIWSLPIDARHARVAGEQRRLTEDASAESHPLLSADGRTLVFHSDRSGKRALWRLDLETGERSAVTAEPTAGAALGRDGSTVAFASAGSIYVVARGGIAEKACDGCTTGNGVWHLSSDGRKVLHDQRPNGTIAVLDIATRRSATVARFPEKGVWDARFSPDDRWLAFHSPVDPGRRQIFVAPFRGPNEIRSDEWIAITDGPRSDCCAAWSPDGNLLYFISDRDGFRCIWVQPLQPDTKRPLGPARALHHLHEARRSLGGLSGAELKLSVAGDKIVFVMPELSGNIWLMGSPRSDSTRR